MGGNKLSSQIAGKLRASNSDGTPTHTLMISIS